MTVTALLAAVPDLLTGLGTAIDTRVDMITNEQKLKNYPHIDDADMTAYLDDYCGDLELSYRDISRAETAIHAWLRAHVPNWARLAITMSLSYDPISNYDRTETRQSETHAEEGGNSSGEANGTETEQVSAYDATGFENRGKTISSGDNSSNYSRESDGNSSDTIRAFGNIGVTTSQQMLESERAISTFNLYQRIAEDFKCRFCILVY